jgi:hypothetical protein
MGEQPIPEMLHLYKIPQTTGNVQLNIQTIMEAPTLFSIHSSLPLYPCSHYAEPDLDVLGALTFELQRPLYY